MSDQLPAKPPMTQEEIEAEAEYEFLSGKEGLEIFCRELREAGFTMPARDIWKYAKRKHIEMAMHATFQNLGGVPGFTFWASRNPSEFYQAYMKLANVEGSMPTGAHIFINTAVPESPLDTIEIDSMGKLKDIKKDE